MQSKSGNKYIDYEYTDKDISANGGLELLKIVMDERGIRGKMKVLIYR